MKYLRIFIFILLCLGKSYLANAGADASIEIESAFLTAYGYRWVEASPEVQEGFKDEYNSRSQLQKDNSANVSVDVTDMLNTEVSYAVKASFLESYGYQWEEASIEVQNKFFERHNIKTIKNKKKQEKYDERLEKNRERIKKQQEREKEKIEKRREKRLKKAEREAMEEQKEKDRIDKAMEKQKEKIKKMREQFESRNSR